MIHHVWTCKHCGLDLLTRPIQTTGCPGGTPPPCPECAEWKRGVEAANKISQRERERVAALEAALRDLLVWAKHVRRRAGVQMDDPNTGAILQAEEVLRPDHP